MTRPRPRPATLAAMKASSSAPAGRTRWSMSLVWATVRAKRDQAQASSRVSRAPGRKPTPPAAMALARPRAATSRASGQLVGTRVPSASRTSGVVRRSGALAHGKAKRSLSVIHSSLTSGSLPAMRRSTTPRRMSTRMAEPEASCSVTESVETRSMGRARKRYLALVRAPTGQIWMMLPEK